MLTHPVDKRRSMEEWAFPEVSRETMRSPPEFGGGPFPNRASGAPLRWPAIRRRMRPPGGRDFASRLARHISANQRAPPSSGCQQSCSITAVRVSDRRRPRISPSQPELTQPVRTHQPGRIHPASQSEFTQPVRNHPAGQNSPSKPEPTRSVRTRPASQNSRPSLTAHPASQNSSSQPDLTPLQPELKTQSHCSPSQSELI